MRMASIHPLRVFIIVMGGCSSRARSAFEEEGFGEWEACEGALGDDVRDALAFAERCFSEDFDTSRSFAGRISGPERSARMHPRRLLAKRYERIPAAATPIASCFAPLPSCGPQTGLSLRMLAFAWRKKKPSA